MAYIRIARTNAGYEVCCTDPEISAENDKKPAAGETRSWVDPDVEFMFETKEQVLKFIASAIDVALPPSEGYSTAFDKFAKEAVK